MYTSFYKLDKKPFEKNPDPSFLWLGEKHKEALSTLLYGILDNKGFLLLTGGAGSGKTILIKALTQSLEQDVEWAVIADPRLERVDFYNAIARGFGIKKPFTSKVQFLIQFSHFLHKADDENKKVLLLVDDCHLLSQEMLEELRLLSNIEKADAKLINIFFVGQPGFGDMLLQPNNRAVNQRLTLKHELESLGVDETDDYIRHRLKNAGTEEKLFSAKAVQAVHRFSQGVPGRINTICSHALISGATQAIQTIDNKVIELCVQKMELPASSHQEDMEGMETMETFSNEKIDFNHFNEIFVPKPAKETPSFSGFNLESDNQWGWLKYALGCLALLAVGFYFWFPVSRSLDEVQGGSAEVAKVPVVKSVSQVSSSPAVTMLEENTSVINGKKAAELKIAILEKAYSSNGKKEEVESVQAGEALVQEAAPTAGGVGQQVVAVSKIESVIQSEGLAQEVVEEKALLAADNSGSVSVLQSEGSPEAPQLERQEKPVVAPGRTEANKVIKATVATVVPLEPKKTILGLRPNSLKLTNVGAKELDSFVEKLKLYPRATVYVKGYVSAKSNSPENIKLSEDRALSVQKLMLAKGIDPEQIEVVGMGNRDPVASNDTREGRRKNRRVEVIVIDDGI